MPARATMALLALLGVGAIGFAGQAGGAEAPARVERWREECFKDAKARTQECFVKSTVWYSQEGSVALAAQPAVTEAGERLTILLLFGPPQLYQRVTLQVDEKPAHTLTVQECTSGICFIFDPEQRLVGEMHAGKAVRVRIEPRSGGEPIEVAFPLGGFTFALQRLPQPTVPQ